MCITEQSRLWPPPLLTTPPSIAEESTERGLPRPAPPKSFGLRPLLKLRQRFQVIRRRLKEMSISKDNLVCAIPGIDRTHRRTQHGKRPHALWNGVTGKDHKPKSPHKHLDLQIRVCLRRHEPWGVDDKLSRVVGAYGEDYKYISGIRSSATIWMVAMALL